MASMHIDAAAANHFIAGPATPGSGSLGSAGAGAGSPALTLDTVRSWSAFQVADWLERNLMGKYARNFIDNEIIGDVLLELTQQHLRDLQIATVGDRVRIERLIINLRRAVLPSAAYPLPTPTTASSPPVPHTPSPPPYSAAGGRMSPKSGIALGGGSGAVAPSSASRKSASGSIASMEMKKSRSEDASGYMGLRQQLAAGDTSPDGIGSAPKLKKSDSIMNMDYVKQNCIKVTGEKNETRVVMLPPSCTDAASIMERILTKFNLPDDAGRFSIFVIAGDSTRVLTDAQLVDICRDPARPEREKMFLRKKHTPFTFSKAAAAAAAASEPTIKQKMGMVEDYLTTRPPVGKSSASKLNKFFGERPPSELISSNLLDFFPKDGVLKIERRKSRSANSNSGGSGPRKTSGQSNLSHVSSVSSEDPRDDANSRLSAATNDEDYQSTVASDLHSDDGSPPPGPGPDTLSSPRSTAGNRGSLNRQRPPPLNLTPVSTTAEIASADARSSPGAGLPSPGFAAPLSRTGSPAALSPTTSEPLTPVSPTTMDTDGDGPPTKWLRGALIGQGSFGSVYMGLHGLTGMLMAVKQVELPADGVGGAEVAERKVRMVEALQHEISFLKEIRHTHIVRYLGSRIEGSYFNIFLEYVPGGSIHGLLQQWNALPEPIVQAYLRQVLLGLAYLHEREIIHRDIKAANILVDNNGCVKISDFGISKRVGPEGLVSVVGGLKADAAEADETGAGAGAANKASVGLSLQGSVYWMSPEVVKHMRYTRKSDVWSVGCLVIEMCTASHPWPNASQVEAIFKIGSDMLPEIPDNISDEAKDFLDLTFKPNYLDRPSADALLRHEFLAKAS
ncbi:ATP binding [Blastocladiella emersonii ATCC 22665]|nr:ATP binding [Blastocladiella emersonii ATCC 22665]